MRRLTVLIFLLFAPSAHAAVNELPFEPRPGAATCLRATATPGTLAVLGPLSRMTSATDLRTLSADGTSLSTRVRLGALIDCAAVALDPSGAAVVAGAVAATHRRLEVRAVVRNPGGAFSAPVRLGDTPLIDASVSAAVSPTGHAVVAWAQRRAASFLEEGPTRIVAARRAPGGSFGAPVALTRWRRADIADGSPAVRAAIDAAGVATVAWVQPVGDEFESEVRVAHAAPGAPFAAQRLARSGDAAHVALAVAPGGFSLVAHDGNGIRAYERAPGADRFTAAVRSDAATFGVERSPVVAVRDGGGGLVAWRSDDDASTAGVTAAVRPAAGPFGEPVEVAPEVRRTGAFGYGEAVFVAIGRGGPFPPVDPGNADLRAALGPDGRALLAWGVGNERSQGAVTTRLAAGTLGGAFGVPRRLGGPARDINGVAPLFLPDGRVAVAWTDNSGSFIPQRHGRLHVAVDGVPEPAEPAAPDLRVRAAATQRLFRSQSVAVRASCAQACDLRAWITSRNGSPDAVTRTLRAGRSVRLRLGDGQPPRNRRARVVVTATAPGGRLRSSVSRHVRIIQRPAPPVPVPLDVEARRDGRSVVVTWRTAFPARRCTFAVFAAPTRRAERDVAGIEAVRGRGRTRFRTRLQSEDGRPLRWVSILAIGEGNAAPKPVRVRVR